MYLKINGLFLKKFLISFCIAKAFFLIESSILLANTTALIPSNFGLNRAETMTAYPYKGSYFWYNPALFKYSGLKINFVGLDIILDDNT